MSDQSLQSRYADVTADIARAARAAGREAGTVRLLAVSKTQPPDKLRAVYALGQRAFGENYAQELVAKAEALKDLPDVTFAFIGALQSNKLAAIVRAASEIQTIADERYARLVARHAKELGKTPYPVYLLVNADGEATKSGLPLAAAPALAAFVARELPELALQGVMAIPAPLPEGTVEPPPVYRALRALADGVGARRLSLGMSDDLEAAIRAGADVVRIGTRLFGARG